MIAPTITTPNYYTVNMNVIMSTTNAVAVLLLWYVMEFVRKN